MRLFCWKNSFVNTAARYTIDHILNQLGYFFEWVENEASVPENHLLLIYGPEQIFENGAKNHLYLPQVISLENLATEQLTWQEAEIDEHTIPFFAPSPKNNTRPRSYFCDLAANVYFHLTRMEEYHLSHPDELNDSMVKQSILYKYGNFMLPVVDMLIADFGRFIERAVPHEHFLIRKTAYPASEDFGLAITHDVDRIAAFHRPTKFLFKILYRTGIYKKQSPRKMDEADRDSWAFDRLLPFYLEKNMRATFFFMSRFREGLHFRYLIKRKKMRHLFKALKKDGHETALHPSRFAFERPGLYLKEKLKLERAARFPIKGMRHHYLRGLFPQLWRKAAELNLNYEATLIHRHFSGFRSATCHAFTSFDHSKQEALPVIAFPTVFFENTLPEEGRNVKKALETIKNLLEQTKTYQGLFTVLWHTNNIYYNAPYPRLWNRILEIAENENAFLTTLTGHYQWFMQRKEIKLRHEDNKLIIELPEGLKKFSLLFPNKPFRFECRDDGVGLNFRNHCLTIDNQSGLPEIHVIVHNI